MVAGKQTSFCWWTGTYNPSEMQGTKTCRLADNDTNQSRRDIGQYHGIVGVPLFFAQMQVGRSSKHK